MASASTMFMNWKVPSRLYKEHPAVQNERMSQSAGYSQFLDREKISQLSEKLPAAYLVRKTHDITMTTHSTPKPGTVKQLRERELEEEVLKTIYAREKEGGQRQTSRVTRFPAMPFLSAKLNANQISARPKDAGVMPVPNKALTMSGRIRGGITQAERNQVNKAFNRSTETDTMKVVDKWLETASPRDRALALEFFGSLAGKRLMGGQEDFDASKQKGDTVCNICDGGRLREVLNALKFGKPPVGDGKRRDIRPGDSNRRQFRLLSPFTRTHKQEMQSWHHLPTFKHTGPVSNTIAHFTRPHRPMPRHFTIHPEWE